MSMICNLRRASVEDVEHLLEAPERISRFLYGEDADMPPSAGGGLLSRLFGGTPKPPPPPVEWRPREDGDEVDLEKSWHGLHFLFTGTAWHGDEPANFLVLGGEAIGDVDVGYGPARAFLPDDVTELARFLATLDADELRRRFDPARMTQLKIYPEIWKAEEADETFGYLLEGFDTLREFVVEAREAGDAIVIYIN